MEIQNRGSRALRALLYLCAGLLMMPSAQADTHLLTPILTCISNVRTVLVGGYPHTYIDAHVGYINSSAATVDVPLGLHNFFTPGESDNGQPTEFLPGRHDNVFSFDIDVTVSSMTTWVLGPADGSDDVQLHITNDPASYCAPTIGSVSPASGQLGQTVTLNVTGTGFSSSLNVELTQGSVTLPVSVATADYSTITASVTIPGDAPKGFYDLRVLRSGDAPVVLPDAFEVMDSASAVQALLRLSPGVLLTGTAGAGVFKSADGGASWTQSNTGLTDLNVTALAAAVDGSAVYAGTLTDGVFKSTDGGATWKPAAGGLDPHIHSLLANPADPLVLFAGTDKGVYKTSDGGQSWQPMTNGLP